MLVPGQIPGAGRTGSGVGCSVVPADVHIEGPVTGEACGGRGDQRSDGPTAPYTRCFSTLDAQALPLPRPLEVVHPASPQLRTPHPKAPPIPQPHSGLRRPKRVPRAHVLPIL